MILNQYQAEAIYSAMCELNNVSGKIKVCFGNIKTDFINVWENETGDIRIVKGHEYTEICSEFFHDQFDFQIGYKIK